MDMPLRARNICRATTLPLIFIGAEVSFCIKDTGCIFMADHSIEPSLLTAIGKTPMATSVLKERISTNLSFLFQWYPRGNIPSFIATPLSLRSFVWRKLIWHMFPTSLLPCHMPSKEIHKVGVSEHCICLWTGPQRPEPFGDETMKKKNLRKLWYQQIATQLTLLDTLKSRKSYGRMQMPLISTSEH